MGGSIYDTSKTGSEIPEPTFVPSREKEGHNLINDIIRKYLIFLSLLIYKDRLTPHY